MNLYLIELTREYVAKFSLRYDLSLGFVIRAKDSKRARKLASGEHTDEGKDAWLNKETSKCKRLASNVRGKEGIILKELSNR